MYQQPGVHGNTEGRVPPPRQILVVDDDVPLANLLRRQLEAEQFSVRLEEDVNQASENLSRNPYHLLILDLNRPNVDAASVLRQLRPRRPQLPIVVLTGRSRVEDRVEWLDSGADDCLTKPFSIHELSARIRALLRRTADPVDRYSSIADLRLDRVLMTVSRGATRLELTQREFALLEYLLRNSPRPIPRRELMEQAWNQSYEPNTNLVDVYAKYVRDKVDRGYEKKLIHTVRGVGYKVSDEQ